MAFDFTPVDELKNILLRADLATYNGVYDKRDTDPVWPVNAGATLIADESGEVNVGEGDWFIRKAYGDIAPGRYRALPPTLESYSTGVMLGEHFWSAAQAPFLLANLWGWQIETYLEFRDDPHSSSARLTLTRVAHHLRSALCITANDWPTYKRFEALIANLAACLDIGIGNGQIEHAQRSVGGVMTPSVTSASAIAYMRSVGACALPTLRVANDWTNDANLRLLRAKVLSGRTAKELKVEYGVRDTAIRKAMKKAADKFGHQLTTKKQKATFITGLVRKNRGVMAV